MLPSVRNWHNALRYAAIGLMTVFMVLIIIMAVLYLFKLFSVFGSKKKATATTAPAPKAAEALCR